MSHTYHHAVSSARLFGGKPEDYQAVHDWFDESKESYADYRHRAVRHHAEGIFEAERVFGVTIKNSAGRQVPVRLIGEQHIKEDCGGLIPTRADWLSRIRPAAWMSRGYTINGLEPQRAREFAAADAADEAARGASDRQGDQQGIPEEEETNMERLQRILPFLPS